MSFHKTNHRSYLQYISPIEDIISDAKSGKIYILVDNENRENEGDVIIPACHCTPEIINFFITHAKGLVCLSIEKKLADKLNLTLQKRMNNEFYSTAFTTSIEARYGVTTGISAFDRSHTIRTAIMENCSSDDISTPGHIFPLISKDNGVLERTGHTEASVDISKLADLHPSAVICEIIKENGDMARLPDIVTFAQKFDLKIGTIADLVEYRKKNI